MTVARLLRQAGYSLQANRKTREGASHPDRNAQFEYINEQATAFQKRGQPVISVDTKKKELVGNFRNAGREWRPKGKPLEVKVHDFQEPELGKVIPYGVYDLTNNEAWVSVGIDHDTAEFAVAAIERWWRKMGRRRFPKAQELYITADGGGSNGSRSRLWKVALQKLANRTGLTLTRQPLSAGNQQVEQNRTSVVLPHHPELAWAAVGESRNNHQVDWQYDNRGWPASSGRPRQKKLSNSQKVSDEQLAEVRLTAATFHGDWNYIVAPD